MYIYIIYIIYHIHITVVNPSLLSGAVRAREFEDPGYAKPLRATE